MSDGKPREVTGDSIAVEIDLLAVPGLEKPISATPEYGLNSRRHRRSGMRFDVTAPPARVVLEAASNGIERVTNGNIEVFVGMVRGGIASHGDLAPGHLDVDRDLVKPAPSMPAIGRFNDDAATHDAAEEPLELVCSFAHAGAHEVGRIDVAEGNLNRKLHGGRPAHERRDETRHYGPVGFFVP